MTRTSPSSFTRRGLAALALSAAASPVAAAPVRPAVVTILGDSITAGLGLPASDALPARLQAALARAGARVTVRGAGVSGDTSAAGLARVDFSVQVDTTVAIVALGGNDLLQGVDPKATKANLDKIIRRLKARRMAVILAGLSAPSAIGRGYARDYNAIFPALAKADGVVLFDLFGGIGSNPRLMQRDGVHPNAVGVETIAARLAPVVLRALKSHP